MNCSLRFAKLRNRNWPFQFQKKKWTFAKRAWAGSEETIKIFQHLSWSINLTLFLRNSDTWMLKDCIKLCFVNFSVTAKMARKNMQKDWKQHVGRPTNLDNERYGSLTEWSTPYEKIIHPLRIGEKQRLKSVAKIVTLFFCTQEKI